MENEINTLANKAIEAAIIEANVSDCDLSTNIFDGEVECLMMGMSFENETTENMFRGLVNKAARKLHAGYFAASKSADAAYMAQLEAKERKSNMAYLGAANNAELLQMARKF